MIELYLSTDGKHTVHVSAETPEQLSNLAPKAKELYERIVESYGNKAQMWQLAIDKKPSAEVKAINPPKAERAEEGTIVIDGRKLQVPICPMHHQPMRYRKGRFGNFWSCGTRKVNGEWCSVTREIVVDDEPAGQ